MKYLLALTLSSVLLLGGCRSGLFGITLFVVGERTALEQQVLGTFEEIGRDLSIYTSVRAVQPDGSVAQPPEITDSQREVLLALNNRRYNRDDVDAMLRAGLVGEGRDGQLVLRSAGLQAALQQQVFAEENRDRAIIVERLMLTTPNVTEDDREEVAWIFATLNHDLAPAGSLIETRDGTWRVK